MAVTRVLHVDDIQRCPKRSFLPGHYREDGTCKCGERSVLRAQREELLAQRAELDAQIAAVTEEMRRS